jgi:hypothetical protein
MQAATAPGMSIEGDDQTATGRARCVP